MDILPAVVTLFLVMDPLGNIPVFLSALRPVRAERRRLVLMREIALAYLVLLACLFIGGQALELMAMERLMGMLLVMVAVQMFLDGTKAFLER